MVSAKTLQKSPDYFEVQDGLAPLSFGLWTQQIVIPASLTANEKVLQHILGHERIHLKNRDGIWSLLALFVQRVAWFNPLSYLFERGRNLAMEMATDEEAIQNFSFSRREYGESLILVLESIRAFESDRMAAAAVLRFSDLKLRLENLNYVAPRAEKSYRKWLALGVMLVGWVWGTNQSFASLRMSNSGGQVLMCYQVQQEKIIEEWLNMKTEANKCE
ncbi:Methicillin resistance mecR1 protein [compost metagenome]